VGVETNDSRADTGFVEGEEIKESGVRVADWIVRVFKIDDKIRAATGVAIVSGVKDAVGTTKLSRAAEVYC
jgi:hypothetical protein